MICGFCGETEEEFEETMTLLDQVDYHVAFLFAYSMREVIIASIRYSLDIFYGSPSLVKFYYIKSTFVLIHLVVSRKAWKSISTGLVVIHSEYHRLAIVNHLSTLLRIMTPDSSASLLNYLSQSAAVLWLDHHLGLRPCPSPQSIPIYCNLVMQYGWNTQNWLQKNSGKTYFAHSLTSPLLINNVQSYTYNVLSSSNK